MNPSAVSYVVRGTLEFVFLKKGKNDRKCCCSSCHMSEMWSTATGSQRLQGNWQGWPLISQVAIGFSFHTREQF